eukprot:Hpha_TRINITY_DN14328_c0_g1::TRINITY_DN14328_c0_g1_i1::g.87198::m.87198
MRFSISVGAAVFGIVLIVYVISLVVWIVTLKVGEEAVDDLADRLRWEVAHSTQRRVSDALDQAETLTRTNALMFKTGAFVHPDRLDPRGKETDHFLRAFRAQMYGSLFVTTVSMTDRHGNLFGVYNDASFRFAGMWEQYYANATAGNVLLDYETYPMGHPREGEKKALIGTTLNYNTSEDIWYTVVNFTQPNGNAWTPMYVMSNEGQVISMISQSHAAFRADGSIVGVATIDLATGFVSEILSSMTDSSMFSFGVDVLPTNGVLLGSSSRDSISKCTDPTITDISLCPPSSQDFVSPVESANGRLTAIAAAIVRRYGSWPAVPESLFKHGGDLIAIEPVQKNLLSWRIIIAVPEDSFLGKTRRSTVAMIIVQACCGVLQIALCALFALEIRRPLQQLVVQVGHLQRFHTEETHEMDTMGKGSILTEIERLQRGHKVLHMNLKAYKPYLPQYVLADGEEEEREPTKAEDGGVGMFEPEIETRQSIRSQPSSPRGSAASSSIVSTVSSVVKTLTKSSTELGLVIRAARVGKARVSLVSSNVVGYLKAHDLSGGLGVSLHLEWMMLDVEKWVGSVTYGKGVVDIVSGDRRSASFNARHQCAMHAAAAVGVAFNRSSENLVVSSGVVTGYAVCGDFGSISLMRFMILGSVASFLPHVERVARRWNCRVLVSQETYGDTALMWDGLLIGAVVYKKMREAPNRLFSITEHKGVQPQENTEWMY